MDLKFEEKRYLILYLEFFKHSYNTNDERKYNLTPTLVRHIEMQNIAYLLEALKMCFTYGFNWGFEYPYSPKFQTVLDNLDKKSKKITEFYDSFNQEISKVNPEYYNELLHDLVSKYLYNEDISDISKVSFVLEDILKEKRGSEFLVDIIYISKTIFPNADLPRVLKELNKRKIYPNFEISEAIWKALGILGIRNVETKKLVRKRI